MNRQKQMMALVLMAVMFVSTIVLVYGDPTGSTILNSETLGAPSSTADSRADPRGTITVLSLSVTQQDQNWKGYVGNVSGRLTLDDANSFTIYDWEVVGSTAGEVYVSRNESPVFTNVSCVTNTTIQKDDTFLGISSTAADSVNRTYRHFNHDAITIGGNVNGTNPLVANSCRSTATYINDTNQTLDGSQFYQAVLAQDSQNNTIFITVLDDNAWGFNNNVSDNDVNKTYDFQIIIPEASTGSATTYYFWTELDG